MGTPAEQQFAGQVNAVAEGVADMVDSYVMMVTDQLCALETEHAANTLSDFADRKARILTMVDTLDRMVARYRVNCLGQ